MSDFSSSSGISNTWWYRPTYFEHPMIQLAMRLGHKFEEVLSVFSPLKFVQVGTCPRCGLAAGLCDLGLSIDYKAAPLCARSKIPIFYIDVCHYETQIWLEAQSEIDPVGKVLSERIRFD